MHSKNYIMAIRINRYLSESGYCSRREADTYIINDEVTINDKPALLNSKVSAGDVVKVDGERIIPIRAINYNPIPTAKPRRKVEEAPKVDKLPKWLIELRKKHGNYVEEERPQRTERAPKAKKSKPKSGSRKHTPKKSFN